MLIFNQRHLRAVLAEYVRHYNDHPHQFPDMATPAERLTPVPDPQRAVLGLWRPPELAPTGPGTENPESPESIDDEPDHPAAPAADPVPAPGASIADQSVGTSTEALAGGNLGVCGQHFWLGPARTGRTLTLRIDTTTVHLSLEGQHLKTLPSRLTTIDMARLRAQRARPAGPPPARPSWTQLSGGAPVEIQRTVNAVGMVSIAGKHHSVGQQFASRRITLRLETTLAHVVLDGVLTRTIPLTLTPTQRARLQGARMPGPAPQPDQRPARVQRTVPRRHPNHRPTHPSRATLCRPDRHHRSRRDHPAHLRPPRPHDQGRSPHQPQGGPPTQGLRSHHQPQNRARHRHPSPEAKTAPIMWS
jgi:hypothetical protein